MPTAVFLMAVFTTLGSRSDVFVSRFGLGTFFDLREGLPDFGN
jgi:hypothetical protein